MEERPHSLPGDGSSSSRWAGFSPGSCWRYTQVGAAAPMSTTATAENIKGEFFSKPWQFAKFRQFQGQCKIHPWQNWTWPAFQFVCQASKFLTTETISLFPFFHSQKLKRKTLRLKFYKQNKAFHSQKLVKKVQPSQSKFGKVKRKWKQRPAAGKETSRDVNYGQSYWCLLYKRNPSNFPRFSLSFASCFFF